MTAWTVGQWVEGQDALPAYWDGASWQDGKVPAPPPITATDVVAGTPGEWLPTGAETPTLAVASTITPAGDTWLEGEWVPTISVAPNDEIHWSLDPVGHWASGRAPAVVVPPVGPASGASAGMPGTFTPDGADLPASENDIVRLTPDPATAWESGQYIVDANGIEYYFDGAEWYVGRAP